LQKGNELYQYSRDKVGLHYLIAIVGAALALLVFSLGTQRK
jgi:hypothetical protein